MQLNANFSQRVIVHTSQQPWQPSPIKGVDRRPLDRVGDEVARATSVVRYAPGSQFAPHVHRGGEEFLVLEGIFQDEFGDYPAGTYVRNPPNTKHQPGSAQGCVILVKLWQFEPDDNIQLVMNTRDASYSADAEQLGVETGNLFASDYEQVQVVKLAANQSFQLSTPMGAELLVLQGEFIEQQQNLNQYSWLRTPIGDEIQGVSGGQGAVFWLKLGHLGQVEKQLQRLGMLD
ncbi:cupin domain-containing protein [Aliiglaciecola sp. LCG003]|uniref:cupin domain-containing protein n=1 Tax=Aliiglaciecola sp. LCG003 TaxID=3053655 RepID=UPI002572F3BC|nr:cupin domain-containing protein [Aliiglaciecola sp. LCG003]WJG09234.1 cupin domain-containing protein [Aliiglaciecola sp. LCG003]